VDKAEVDCLIMANPCGNWEQAIGRAVRPSENKKQPVIIDIVDLDVDHYVKWAERRKEQYLEKGWLVEERVIRYT
jgi:superfamily II DNA or RNA helicase